MQSIADPTSNNRPSTSTFASMEPTKKKEMEKILSQHMSLINGTLEKWIPRNFSVDDMIAFCGRPRYDWDMQAINKSIINPIWEFIDRGGKRWRSTLLLLIAEAFGKKAEDVVDFVVLTEIIHNGSLIIDDIEDNSEYRRGKPCLHKMVGVDVAVNTGNFMYFLPLRVLRDKGNELAPDTLLKCYEVYSHEMLNVHLGQGLDICWHSKKLGDEAREPTVENYLQMCANKTGALARMSARLSALICGGTQEQVEAIGAFAESIGIAFQIQDDILNIQTDGMLSASKGGAGEDIHEGKRTIMVIHCFNTAPLEDVKRLKEILSMHTNDQILIDEAIQILKRNKSIEFAQEKAKDLIVDAWVQVDTLLPSSPAKSKLKALVDYLIQRDV